MLEEGTFLPSVNIGGHLPLYMFLLQLRKLCKIIAVGKLCYSCPAQSGQYGLLLALWLLRLAMGVWPWSMASMAHATHVTGTTRSKEGRITLPAGVMSQCLDLRERWRAPHPVIRLQRQEFYGAVTKLFISEHTLLATCYICWQYTEEFVWLKDDQSTLLRRRLYCA